MKTKLVLKLAALATLACTAVTLSSCGGYRIQPGDWVAPEGGFDESAEVTISFYSTMGDDLQKVFDTYLADFNELYPNIHVEHEPIGGYDDVRDQIKTELSVGQGPNLAYCYPDHVALYNKSGRVCTLDPLIHSTEEVTLGDGTKTIIGLTDEEIDNYIPGYYEEGKQFGDNKLYTLPFSKSTEVLYYNVDFFEKNNLTVPTTWDEMEETLKRIKEIDPDSTPLGYDSEANWFITMCEQLNTPYTSATGEHFLFNTPENKEFVQRFANWYKNGYITTQELNGGYTSDLFVSQKSYMSIGSSAGATHQLPAADASGVRPFEVGIAPIPQADAENHPAVISQGPSLVMFKDEDPQKVYASWLLMKFMTSNAEFQAQFSISSGYVPAVTTVNDIPAYQEHLSKADGGDNISALAAKVCMEQEEWYFTSPAFIGSSEARDQVGNLMQAVLSGSKDIDKAFSDAIAECEASL